MVVTKTPLRISFCGGGSDIEYFYSKHGGAVLSTAIDKYIYVAINKKFNKGYRVTYSLMENVQEVEEIKHPIVRHSLDYLDFNDDIEIVTISDIPSSGSGLGSSSSFTVGLLNALYAYRNIQIDKHELAEKSCHLEIKVCNEPIGKQDQYAAVFGGLNFIVFNQNGTVEVNKLNIKKDVKSNLQNNLMFFYTGITRSASKILIDQRQHASTAASEINMKKIVELTYLMKQELESGSLDNFGSILHESWILKKSLSKLISNQNIDEWYKLAINCGALGGKILGAGSGGFLMLYCPNKEIQAKIEAKLNFLRRVHFKFESDGTLISKL